MRRIAARLRARWLLLSHPGASMEASAEVWSLLKGSRADDENLELAAMPRLQWPVGGRITSRFQMRRGRLHEGIDIAAPAGTPVCPALHGAVLLAGDLGAYGNVVVIRHSAVLATVYAHLESVYVTESDRVGPDRQLGTVGSTGHSRGYHLHFEVRFDGTAVDPLVFLGESAPMGSGDRS